MKAHRKPQCPINALVPKRGMGVQVYLSHKTIGSGVRAYLIIGVSSRYVTLFYPAKLKAVKLKRKSWESAPATEHTPNAQWLYDTICERMTFYREHKWKFNRSVCDKALAILINLGATHV